MVISSWELKGLVEKFSSAENDSKFEFTQMLNWLHIRDRISGEGYWVWNGSKEIHRFNKASTDACEKQQEPTR